MRVALISDTHLPPHEPELPGWITDRLRSADYVIHAGDFTSPQSYFQTRVSAGGNLVGVRGNRDRAITLPRIETLECGGVRFVVTHGDELGHGKNYRAGLLDLARAYDADVAVGGHTHRLLVEARDGVRLLNPGSATGKPPSERASMLSVECDAGESTVTVYRDPGTGASSE